MGTGEFLSIGNAGFIPSTDLRPHKYPLSRVIRREFAPAGWPPRLKAVFARQGVLVLVAVLFLCLTHLALVLSLLQVFLSLAITTITIR